MVLDDTSLYAEQTNTVCTQCFREVPMTKKANRQVKGAEKITLAAPKTQKEAKQQIASLLRKNAEAMKALA
ncbi:hypothetical protein GCM10008959_41290 [Deinococcus seoulensis]|uniref:Uncharacterized protein n=2 Tax=Deinococcus TaxID=1298 RepID=A0ABQ2RXI9_9DEIO|nr:hypothetical protein GCM10008959_41290 [Deinococcus seoulensis]GGS13667.1 hypothetical protein GCM10008961_01040 [Deinococcus knuensis]